MKGQSLNEPLGDLPPLLTISLPSAGRQAQPVLFHSITFSEAFSTCLLHTNKLIINEDTNWGLFPWKLLQLCPYPRFTGAHQPAFLSAPSLCLCLAGAALPVPNAHSASDPELLLTCAKPIMSTCMCLCAWALTQAQEREQGSFIHWRISLFPLDGSDLTCMCFRQKYPQNHTMGCL